MMLLVNIKKENYHTKKKGLIYKISLGVIDFYLLNFIALSIFNGCIILIWIFNKNDFYLSEVILPNAVITANPLIGVFKYIFLIVVVLYVILLFLRKYHVNKN